MSGLIRSLLSRSLLSEDAWISLNRFEHLRVQLRSPLLVRVHTPFGSTSRTYYCIFGKSKLEQSVLLRFGECTAYHVRRYSLVVDHLAIVLKLAEPKQIPFARCILSILGRLGPRQELACVFIQRVSGLAAEFAIIGVPIFLVTIFTKPKGFVGSVGIYVVFYCRYIRAGCGPPSSNFTCTRR